MKVLLCISLLLAGFNLIFAEGNNTGTIEGIVTERSTKQPLTGVNIILLNTGFGSTSNENGKYQIKNIPAGHYQIKASMIGYEVVIKANIFVTTNRVTTVNFELSPSAIELNKTIEVTSGYFESTPEKPVSVKNLNADDISSSPGSGEDIFRVAKTLPGVSVSNGGNTNLIVRGGGPDENLTLLENIEIVSPLHFGNINGNWGLVSIINPDMLENAEFISGGFPAEYNGKLSSMFKLSLKKGNDIKFNHDINLNMAGLGLSGDGPIYGNGNIVFSVRRGIFDLITDMMNREAMPRYWDAVAKATYDLGTSNKISFVGFYYKDDFTKDQRDPESHMEEGRKFDYIKKDSYGSAAGINWNYLFSSKGYLLTTASATANGWNDIKGTNNRKDANGEDLIEKEFTLKSELTYKLFPYIELKGGIQYKIINSDHKIWADVDTLNNGVLLPADTIYYYPPNSNKKAIFMQATIIPFNSLFITAGLRYDFFSLTTEKILRPRISLSWNLNKYLIFNAAYGRYSQDPTTYQMELNEINNKLISSKSEQFIAGIESILRNDIKLSFEGFYKKLGDLFVESDSARIISNSGSGYAAGLEVFLQKKMSDKLVGSISYSYSLSKRKDNNFSDEFLYEYDRTHNFNLVSSYRLSDSWQIGFKYTFMTGMPYTPILGVKVVNGKHTALEGGKNSDRLPSYQQLDIRIDRTFVFKNWSLCVYMDIWNILNRKNVVDYVYSMKNDGSISKGEIYDFKIMPIAGISARF